MLTVADSLSFCWKIMSCLARHIFFFSSEKLNRLLSGTGIAIKSWDPYLLIARVRMSLDSPPHWQQWWQKQTWAKKRKIFKIIFFEKIFFDIAILKHFLKATTATSVCLHSLYRWIVCRGNVVIVVFKVVSSIPASLLGAQPVRNLQIFLRTRLPSSLNLELREQ